MGPQRIESQRGGRSCAFVSFIIKFDSLVQACNGNLSLFYTDIRHIRIQFSFFWQLHFQRSQFDLYSWQSTQRKLKYVLKQQLDE